MKHPNNIPQIQRLLSLPHERKRNCEEPVKGQARWRGSLRSPLTEPSQFQPTPPLWKRKKKIEMSVARCVSPNGRKVIGHGHKNKPRSVFRAIVFCIWPA